MTIARRLIDDHWNSIQKPDGNLIIKAPTFVFDSDEHDNCTKRGINLNASKSFESYGRLLAIVRWKPYYQGTIMIHFGRNDKQQRERLG
jgi:hypothetical protein